MVRQASSILATPGQCFDIEALVEMFSKSDTPSDEDTMRCEPDSITMPTQICDFGAGLYSEDIDKGSDPREAIADFMFTDGTTSFPLITTALLCTCGKSFRTAAAPQPEFASESALAYFDSLMDAQKALAAADVTMETVRARFHLVKLESELKVPELIALARKMLISKQHDWFRSGVRAFEVLVGAAEAGMANAECCFHRCSLDGTLACSSAHPFYCLFRSVHAWIRQFGALLAVTFPSVKVGLCFLTS